jgi:hypothetical protein
MVMALTANGMTNTKQSPFDCSNFKKPVTLTLTQKPNTSSTSEVWRMTLIAYSATGVSASRSLTYSVAAHPRVVVTTTRPPVRDTYLPAGDFLLPILDIQIVLRELRGPLAVPSDAIAETNSLVTDFNRLMEQANSALSGPFGETVMTQINGAQARLDTLQTDLGQWSSDYDAGLATKCIYDLVRLNSSYGGSAQEVLNYLQGAQISNNYLAKTQP